MKCERKRKVNGSFSDCMNCGHNRFFISMSGVNKLGCNVCIRNTPGLKSHEYYRKHQFELFDWGSESLIVIR